MLLICKGRIGFIAPFRHVLASRRWKNTHKCEVAMVRMMQPNESKQTIEWKFIVRIIRLFWSIWFLFLPNVLRDRAGALDLSSCLNWLHRDVYSQVRYLLFCLWIVASAFYENKVNGFDEKWHEPVLALNPARSYKNEDNSQLLLFESKRCDGGPHFFLLTSTPSST